MMNNIYVARQAILNKNKDTIAYELLFRDGLKNNYMNENVDGYIATKDVLLNSMVFLGLHKLAGNKKVFINFTGQNIIDGNVQLLPAEMVFIEILENTEPTNNLLNKCQLLKEKGYKFVLDDFMFAEKYQKFIDLADIIKIDFMAITDPLERQCMRKIIPAHVKLLAEKVETENDYEQALTFGYELFQGYFFCRPIIVTGRVYPINDISQISLLKEVNQSDVDVEHIENIIKRDVSLVHKLLKYINSPGVGIPNTVHNIKQAVTLLGVKGMQNWTNLLCLRELMTDKPNEIFVLSLIRAKFCELVAANIPELSLEKDTAFLVGILSLSDIVLEEPMEKIAEDLGLTNEVRKALLSNNNQLGALLSLALKYEQASWSDIADWCIIYNIPENLLALFYNEAIEWSNNINHSI